MPILLQDAANYFNLWILLKNTIKDKNNKTDLNAYYNIT